MLILGRTSLKEPVLTYMNTTLSLRHSQNRVSHLLRVSLGATGCEMMLTSFIQVFMILGMSRSVEAWMPSHKSFVTAFLYRCFFKYIETPLRNLSSPT